MITLAFSYGHGLHTSGKQINSDMGVGVIKEFTLNKMTGEYCKEYLLANYDNVEIIYLNDVSGQVDTPLAQRSSKANKLGVDAVFDFHHNAGGGTGIVVFKYTHTSPKTDQLAQAICDELLLSPGNKGNRWSNLLRENFHMVREPKMPAVLIENGFMDNKTDVNKIITKDYQQKSGVAIAKGIAKVFNLPKKSGSTTSTPTVSTPSTSGSYTVKVNTDLLNVRTGPGTGYAVATTVKKNEVYTIVETSGNWGKLKSGAGWICLDYTIKTSIAAEPTRTVSVGCKVKVTGTNYATGQTVPEWVKSNVYTVSQINGDKALLKEITSWVYTKDLVVQ